MKETGHPENAENPQDKWETLRFSRAFKLWVKKLCQTADTVEVRMKEADYAAQVSDSRPLGLSDFVALIQEGCEAFLTEGVTIQQAAVEVAGDVDVEEVDQHNVEINSRVVRRSVDRLLRVRKKVAVARVREEWTDVKENLLAMMDGFFDSFIDFTEQYRDYVDREGEAVPKDYVHVSRWEDLYMDKLHRLEQSVEELTATGGRSPQSSREGGREDASSASILVFLWEWLRGRR